MSRNQWAQRATDAAVVAARNNPALAAVGAGGVVLVAAPVLLVAPVVAAANIVGFGAAGVVACKLIIFYPNSSTRKRGESLETRARALRVLRKPAG